MTISFKSSSPLKSSSSSSLLSSGSNSSDSSSSSSSSSRPPKPSSTLSSSTQYFIFFILAIISSPVPSGKEVPEVFTFFRRFTSLPVHRSKELHKLPFVHFRCLFLFQIHEVHVVDAVS